jgi:hypothetical protein
VDLQVNPVTRNHSSNPGLPDWGEFFAQFAQRVIVNFRQFFKIQKYVAHIFGLICYAVNCDKKAWATFLVIFFANSSGHTGWNQGCQMVFLHTKIPIL